MSSPTSCQTCRRSSHATSSTRPTPAPLYHSSPAAPRRPLLRPRRTSSLDFRSRAPQDVVGTLERGRGSCCSAAGLLVRPTFTSSSLAHRLEVSSADPLSLSLLSRRPRPHLRRSRIDVEAPRPLSPAPRPVAARSAAPAAQDTAALSTPALDRASRLSSHDVDLAPHHVGL